jgi:hypothetical protein
MTRALMVAALAAFSWLVVGAQGPLWAVQQSTKADAEQRALSDKVRVLRPGTEISVFTKDGFKIEGILREVRADVIVVTHKKGGGSSSVMLADIDRIQTKGQGLHPATKVLIVVGATLGALYAVAVATC